MGTITLRLDDDQDKQLEVLKRLTGQATGSKAIEFILAKYPGLVKQKDQYFDNWQNGQIKINRINEFYKQMMQAKNNLEDELDLRN